MLPPQARWASDSTRWSDQSVTPPESNPQAASRDSAPGPVSLPTSEKAYASRNFLFLVGKRRIKMPAAQGSWWDPARQGGERKEVPGIAITFSHRFRLLNFGVWQLLSTRPPLPAAQAHPTEGPRGLRRATPPPALAPPKAPVPAFSDIQGQEPALLSGFLVRCRGGTGVSLGRPALSTQGSRGAVAGGIGSPTRPLLSRTLGKLWGVDSELPNWVVGTHL